MKPTQTHLTDARLQAVLKLVPAIQLFTLIDAILLAWYFWDDASPWFLVLWTAVVATQGVVWTIFSRTKPQPGGSGNPKRWRWMLLQAVLEGTIFSVFIVVVFPGVSPDKSVVLASFITGLLSAGALSKMSIPRAAYLFIATLAVGAEIGLLTSSLPSPWILELLLMAFAIALSSLVARMSRVFDDWVEAEFELGLQKTVVQDLLEDFGESTNDGLWEADSRGRLTYLSPRLVELFEENEADLVGRPLVPDSEWTPPWTKAAAFRNLEAAVTIRGRRRWWTLTGKPLKDLGQVIGWRGVASDVTEHRQRELEMLRLARFDSLTGLLNRRAFRARLDELFAPGEDPGHRFLVLIDLVDFKEVNETRGHAFGDALLVAVADRLRRETPKDLVLARLDGDEFALQGPVDGSTLATLSALKHLVELLTEPYQVTGDRVMARFSIGVSFTPADATTADQWLRCTDLALRTAKGAGRNVVQAYQKVMMEGFLDRALLKEALHNAKDSGEIHLEYQPIVELATGKITGFEALARWDHPTRGSVPPSTFIALAEESEVILDLGLWVLEQACLAARDWPETISLSVNVSGVQLRSPQLADEVMAIVTRVGLDPHRLVLEVTESALVKNGPGLSATFQSLRTKGIRWALDDFGTGFSSLSYLQDFPFDKLKIDQSFVRSQPAENRLPALLGAIVTLARTLGLTTTAEGIEEESHRARLYALGCQEGQGYLFSRPVASNQVPGLLKVSS